MEVTKLLIYSNKLLANQKKQKLSNNYLKTNFKNKGVGSDVGT